MQRNSITQCKVCGAKEHVCFHFGVSTCRACGAFFRRYINNGEVCKFECKCLQKPLSKENKDGTSQTNLAKCKKCRLDKCLLVGMKRLNVMHLRYDVNLEEIEKQKNKITPLWFFDFQEVCISVKSSPIFFEFDVIRHSSTIFITYN
uniref:Nuclear receptor domain-containing protein n=1 Tax=Meloidogyne incognita TaxID=6306 RepID=A0A914LIG1_MELIC